MIELLTADTPNGKKISIMLEEIGFEYKVTKINLKPGGEFSKGEQFKPEFRKISPFSKIPVIIDHDNNKEVVFESGAILMYLGEKSNKFYEQKDRTKINQWLMAQMGYVGPMLGQHHQFHRYNSGKDKWGEERYFKITKTVYGDLVERLGQSKYLDGDNYSIADIATFPWIARHDWHDIGLKNFKYLSKWYKIISNRAAVKKGYDCLNTGENIPEIKL